MNTLTHTQPRSGSISLGSAPRYGQPELSEQPSQRSGFDSSGDFYCYGGNKTPRVVHRLAWSNFNKTRLDDLLRFHQEAQGCKHLIVWVDYLGVGHAVNFLREQIHWKQTGPDRYQVTIGLEESIALTLIDENDNILIDENNNELTW